MEKLNELKALRSEKRSTLAKKVLEILDFCNENEFQNLYETKSLMYSTAYSGQYDKVLIIRKFDDAYVGITIDAYKLINATTEKEKIDYIANNICCNNGKRYRYGGNDYNTQSWLEPKMKEVKEWIETMKEKLETKINEEIEWLKNWN